MPIVLSPLLITIGIVVGSLSKSADLVVKPVLYEALCAGFEPEPLLITMPIVVGNG